MKISSRKNLPWLYLLASRDSWPWDFWFNRCFLENVLNLSANRDTAIFEVHEMVNNNNKYKNLELCLKDNILRNHFFNKGNVLRECLVVYLRKNWEKIINYRKFNVNSSILYRPMMKPLEITKTELHFLTNHRQR